MVLCRARCISFAVICMAVSPVWASGPTEAEGLWLSAQKDAVLEFKPCPANPMALCGRIVWDKDAGTPASSCGAVVAQLERYDKDAWRDGWVYDPRDHKKYRGVVRVKEGELHIRAFVGNEMLGQTEQLTRASALPAAPTCGS